MATIDVKCRFCNQAEQVRKNMGLIHEELSDIAALIAIEHFFLITLMKLVNLALRKRLLIWR
ncbi:hypothetical protein BEI67_04405 [Photobacterium damselae subsp. piscicida]|nr:hypothetical protein BEI67_04405 [Photobacterium damselae subsp. piscicida]